MTPESELLFAAKAEDSSKKTIDDHREAVERSLASLKQAAATAETEEELDAIHAKMLQLTEEYKSAERELKKSKIKRDVTIKIVRKDDSYEPYNGLTGRIHGWNQDKSIITVIVNNVGMSCEYSIDDLEICTESEIDEEKEVSAQQSGQETPREFKDVYGTIYVREEQKEKYGLCIGQKLHLTPEGEKASDQVTRDSTLVIFGFSSQGEVMVQLYTHHGVSPYWMNQYPIEEFRRYFEIIP